MPQLLLEIFSEEIPARMQQGAARDLERMVSDRLKAAGLTWEALNVFAGPRRLTLVIDGLPTAADDRNEEVKGPKTSAPAQALEGFLRKTGLTQDQLVERDGVWFAEISSKGRQTTEVFAEAVDQIVRSFPWPKSMRWGTGTLRWVRPIKRIIALFDGAVVPFEIDGIHSGDVTEGHRFLGSGKPFAVKDFADYRAKLEKEYVLLDVADRKLRILEGAKAACATRGLVLVDDDGLLDEVAGLAEWPTPILGDMDPQFLSLPPEVVRLSMKVHQKYFAVRDPSKDGLAPNFLVVANVEATDGGKALAAGNSRVLSARLNDARFFWDEDQKVGFDAWNDKLKGVTFHAKLGTLAERVDRIAALAREIAPLVGADADQAEQAARLSKADLASGMVSEFPELQGIMGGYYARLAGYPDAVADAVRDHYKPQGPGDSVPIAPVTVAVAIAEKLDTLVGFFAIDEKPTGSRDPYALRRAALGVIRLVLENGARAPLAGLITIALDAFVTSFNQRATVLSIEPEVCQIVSLADVDSALSKALWVMPASSYGGAYNEEGLAELAAMRLVELVSVGELQAGVLAFFADRLTVLLRDQGQRHDLVAAVFALGDDDLVRIVRRVEALAAFLATDDGANLLAGYKRASNILKAEEKKGPLPTGAVATGLPSQPAEETALAFAAAAAATAVDAALETEDFAAAMTALAALRGPVDAFFTGVMVNSDVAEERDNRLKLLGQVRAVMGRVADFGQIAG
ncbi:MULTISPECIES: glycine--tRNA ligase subunit beta [unclassified Brevundimonas]|uniref:glycine--tRNA ligase subunit beta n=1 Tax=unclassified Brevundimonas TaxID=2622653 RepID=UPI000CFB0E86|nr:MULTISPECIES: glycine--tRNA ligase subunit beta [unclassified Brevundimonas]PRA35781.1 glycine--tRNA ligase subunit beta [Brevundimonas sp. MYb27]PQZ83122.1 glycine--tRNA ligase subunit beta [Brevundimonas sp. MYb31]PRB16318.1 glycine--tRNA ligase subunit beta [Brevundimonas sp. MYb52]PRB34917.1 glycine--tRNA ligase subunit beta [Brevundimonas sp. MYb46]PRB55575.1 glycine--tRNA ligase subunit beta [Brevundimonas sp. MYb33]